VDQRNARALFEKAFILLTAVEDLEQGLKALEAAVGAGFREPEAYGELLEHEDMIGFARVRAFVEERNLLSEPEEDEDGEEPREQGEAS
jgi:hypothetical protein